MCGDLRKRRKYVLKRRAARQEETRRRIVEAAVELHGKLGPARTSISAVAGRAGVQRHTFYRYFEDEEALFRACSVHFLAAHPPPDPAGWLTIGDPRERLTTGLRAAYAYYDANEAMIANVLRDADIMPVGGGFLLHGETMLDVLLRAWRVRGRRRALLQAALALALDFHTWRVLVRERGLHRDQAVDVATGIVCYPQRAGALRAGISGYPAAAPSAARSPSTRSTKLRTAGTTR